MFSKTCEYGIKAVLMIAKRSLENKRVNLKEIAEEIDSPEAFTAKILQLLAKQKIIDSLKGPTGGFLMNQDQIHGVSLLQIVGAIDGDKIYNGCALGLHDCDADKPCPMHEQFVSIRDNLKNMLSNTTVYELAMELKEGQTYLMR